MHVFFLGLLLGWGVAIPIGPMNLEVIRRNLRFGTPTGLSLGFGACSADITYLILLSCGALVILQHPIVIKCVSVIGALILLYFAWQTLKQKIELDTQKTTANLRHLYLHYFQGYLMTLASPFTILFWASVSAQVALFSHGSPHAAFLMGLGVLFATVSWIISLNTVIHVIRHRLSANVVKWLNYSGAIILIGFALLSFFHVFY